MSYESTLLVGLYDEDNPDGPDHDFYRSLVAECERAGSSPTAQGTGASAGSPLTVVDVGCGTGLLTVTLTGPGRRVIGLDPAEAMLAIARARSGGDAVEWIVGDAASASDKGSPAAGTVDVVVMTGNVAQHLIGESWSETLAAIARLLRPGGTLAFEARNGRARSWENWHDDAPMIRETARGRLSERTEVLGSEDLAVRDDHAKDPDDRLVHLRFHNDFTDLGTTVVEDLDLEFRTFGTTRRALDAAGLVIGSVAADWDGRAFDDSDPLMIITARKP